MLVNRVSQSPVAIAVLGLNSHLVTERSILRIEKGVAHPQEESFINEKCYLVCWCHATIVRTWKPFYQWNGYKDIEYDLYENFSAFQSCHNKIASHVNLNTNAFRSNQILAPTVSKLSILTPSLQAGCLIIISERCQVFLWVGRSDRTNCLNTAAVAADKRSIKTSFKSPSRKNFQIFFLVYQNFKQTFQLAWPALISFANFTSGDEVTPLN